MSRLYSGATNCRFWKEKQKQKSFFQTFLVEWCRFTDNILKTQQINKIKKSIWNQCNIPIEIFFLQIDAVYKCTMIMQYYILTTIMHNVFNENSMQTKKINLNFYAI